MTRWVRSGKPEIVMVPFLAHEDRILGVEVLAPTPLRSTVFWIVTPGTMMIPRVEGDDRYPFSVGGGEGLEVNEPGHSPGARLHAGGEFSIAVGRSVGPEPGTEDGHHRMRSCVIHGISVHEEAEPP
jgi:hypothetical protein